MRARVSILASVDFYSRYPLGIGDWRQHSLPIPPAHCPSAARRRVQREHAYR